MERLSKSAIDRLGDRLRLSGIPSEDDIRELNELLEAHKDALVAAAAAVHQEVSMIRIVAARLKSASSTIEKLRRSRTMRLSQVQDLAGVRVVVEGGRAAQDRAVAELTEKFPGAIVDDRRAKPQFGYRAVHVVAPIKRQWAEIQVRTPRQHSWAELMEKIADSWGREIRYGGDPLPNDVAPDIQRGFLKTMQNHSGLIDTLERLELTGGYHPRVPELAVALDQLTMELRDLSDRYDAILRSRI